MAVRGGERVDRATSRRFASVNPETTPGGPAARVLVAAGAFFTDEYGQIMLVRPTYKPYWDIPGGYVEPTESPR
ncbi:NUDIX domain-containing protein, partial [Asanoa siamensis]|uniref:NUDIX domain-containing protein n=1 Tax=Asanoa siamensis TaxID=926357 RepID=UPI0019421B67